MPPETVTTTIKSPSIEAEPQLPSAELPLDAQVQPQVQQQVQPQEQQTALQSLSQEKPTLTP